MDRISKLPIGIIETILCLLPIHEAARTSILSREWRYHWIKIPKLVFNERTFQVSTDGAELFVLEQAIDEEQSIRKEMAKRLKLFYAIYQVLLMHQGPMHEFTLSMKVDDSCVVIDHIILHLLKKNALKIFKLDLNGSYTLPLSFFSLHQLTDLYLTDCVLDHQPSSYVFGSLTTLYLQDINICAKAFLRLLSSCPLLKRLTIVSHGEPIDDIGDSTIADLVECVPVIEYRVVLFIFLCYLPFPKELPSTLVHLEYLCMDYVVFSHKNALPFLVLLIRSSPNLEKLKLEIYVEYLSDESEMGSFTLEDDSDIMLEHLNELEILHYGNDENELVFVKLILAKSPVLKNVRILIGVEFDEDEKLQISKILLSFPCASPVVKISFS